MIEAKQCNFEFTGKLQDLPANKVNLVIVHCSDFEPEHDATVIHQWHLARGWSGIGYHYFIKKDGTVQQGRPLNKRGAHCKGKNFHSIGICLEGKREFTPNQVESFLKIKFLLDSTFTENTLEYKGHGYFDVNKTCPNICVTELLKGNLKVLLL